LHVEERLRNDDRITTLVNNAGIAVLGEFVGQDIDKVDTMIQLNVLAPTRLAHAIAGRLAEAGGGAIINIGSVVALMPETFSGAYAATKAFVLNLSLTLNQELSGSGVRVQAVLPGATRTEIWERSGVDVNGFPPEMLMGAENLVDAALAGFDSGETVTIPSLPDVAQWEALTAARLHLGPNLSRNTPAERYRQGIAAKA
jgi:short-subunit dehydrogenase